MSERILVLIKHLDDLEPARAVLSAASGRAFTLAFFNEDLRTRFGDSEHATSTDALEHVLNAEQYALVVCFAGAPELSLASNYLALNFFEEIGVPTVELQRDLLRDPVKAQEESVARHYVAWSGSEGVGYLKASNAGAGVVRDDVVLVSSQLASPLYSEEQRYQFAFGVMRLAREYPQLSFLWRASTAEEQSAEAKLVLAMLGSTGPENLWLEESEPCDELVARASAVITMAQTALLDYAAAKKPSLVYVNEQLEARLAELTFRRFVQPDELLSAFRALRAEPTSFLVESKVPSFQPAALNARLAQIEKTRALKPERREIRLRYLAYLQDARARADLGRMNPQISALERRIAEFEKLLTASTKAADDARKQAARKNGNRQLNDVAQRAWKLARAVQKRAFK